MVSTERPDVDNPAGEGTDGADVADRPQAPGTFVPAPREDDEFEPWIVRGRE
jgi:hypothetical protein